MAEDLTTAASQGSFDLSEELVRGDSKPEDREPQHERVLERHVVLPECVTDDVGRPQVVDPVDLDDDTPLLPYDVEVVATLAPTPDHLTAGLGEAATPAFTSEVQLAQGLRTAGEVEDDLVYQAAATVASDAECLQSQRLRRDEPLLHAHREDESRLAVGHGPQSPPNGCDRGRRPRDPTRDQVACIPAPRLPDVQPASTAYPCATRHGDTDPVGTESRQPGSDQG
jgi:hypothetical protein